MIFPEFKCLQDCSHLWHQLQCRDVPINTLTSDTNCTSSEVPKITRRFNNLLEGLTELIEIVILMVTVYYSKRVQVSQPREEVLGAQSRRVLHMELSLVLCQWNCGQNWPLSGTIYDNTHGVLPTSETYLCLSIQILLGGSITEIWLTTHVSDF